MGRRSDGRHDVELAWWLSDRGLLPAVLDGPQPDSKRRARDPYDQTHYAEVRSAARRWAEIDAAMRRKDFDELAAWLNRRRTG